jgi:predicted component of type VI protein secretion system
MAYLILSDRRGEFDRRDLREPLVIGRALDCDICIRDILLSRRHCRIERFHDRWIVVDLESKNGTKLDGDNVTRHVLRDGDVVRIGRSQVSFHAGAFVPMRSNTPRRDERPADPIEALAGTVCGFQVFDMEEDSRISGFPIPRPRPAEPRSFRHNAVHSIVTDLASTTWDTRLSHRSSQARPLKLAAPKPIIQEVQPVPARPPALIGTYLMLACVVAAISFGVILFRSLV